MRAIRTTFTSLVLLLACGLAQAATTACSAHYSTRNDWATGFVVDVALTNSGTTPVTGWKVEWTYPVPVNLVNSPWRASVTIANGTITAVDNGANPSLAPGATVTFGMALSHSGGTKPVPIALYVSGANCILPEVFYVDPNSNAAIWARNNGADWRATDIRAYIAEQPSARWFGDWSGDIAAAVNKYVSAAASLRQMPVLVAYNIPGRDCGLHSSGGAQTIETYKQWISAFASGIGQRKAVVILEPDAIPHLDCLSAEGQAARLEMLRHAAAEFRQHAPGALLYLDAGHSEWLSATEAAQRLMQAGVADARGFSLNVSNYKTTESNTSYGKAVAAALLQTHGISSAFIIDTSRNGNGPSGTMWCDPPGRKLGVRASEDISGNQPEMTLWIKHPGNADGCAAPAGSFSPDIAYKLIYGYP